MGALPIFIDWQIESALSLARAPRAGVVVTEFTCEEIGRGTRKDLYVTRRYSPIAAPSLYYFECYSIGPRGGRKLRASSGPY
jgi:hypothetical protein